MANQYEDFDGDEDTRDDGPADLRKAFKKVKREAEEYRKELEAFRAERREQSVKGVLEAEGVSAKIAKFIPSDVNTPEQVKFWLSENADVFGIGRTETATDEEVENPKREAFQRINNATQTANTAAPKQEDQARALANVTSREELDKLIFGQNLGRN